MIRLVIAKAFQLQFMTLAVDSINSHGPYNSKSRVNPHTLLGRWSALVLNVGALHGWQSI